MSSHHIHFHTVNTPDLSMDNLEFGVKKPKVNRIFNNWAFTQSTLTNTTDCYIANTFSISSPRLSISTMVNTVNKLYINIDTLTSMVEKWTDNGNSFTDP